jgi:hypothetical protein
VSVNVKNIYLFKKNEDSTLAETTRSEMFFKQPIEFRYLHISSPLSFVEIAKRRCKFIWRDGSGDVGCASTTRSGDKMMSDVR